MVVVEDTVAVGAVGMVVVEVTVAVGVKDMVLATAAVDLVAVKDMGMAVLRLEGSILIKSERNQTCACGHQNDG